MRELRYKGFLLRDYTTPVIVDLAWSAVAEDGEEYPQIQTEERREIIYQGDLWPTPNEVRDAIQEYQLRFAHAPEHIVFPRLDGAKFDGIEVIA